MALSSVIKINSPKSTTKHSNYKSADTSDNYDIELLEYEWPELPPLTQVRDAITRNKLSCGISYILPLDPVSADFKPDLRAMFVQPNRSYDNCLFDSTKLTPSAKVRYFSNSVDTKWTDKSIRKLSSNINSESEKVRKLYGRSAPTLSSAKRRMGLDVSQSRQRSSLHVQIKANEPPEATQMREEVNQIITSLQEDDGEFNIADEREISETDLSKAMKTTPFKRKESVFKESAQDHCISNKMDNLKLGQRRFSSYKTLNNTEPPKLIIPNVLRSTYLSDELNQNIWEWLHQGEQMTNFDFFLSVCG